VSRVYRAKLRDLHDILIMKKHFDKVIAYAHVTEFQKSDSICTCHRISEERPASWALCANNGKEVRFKCFALLSIF
jgi:hypothetical protein